MNRKSAEDGPGLTKIHAFCALALEKRYTWVWIDTCCIDKKSSAELSEAINSMFQWYQCANECIVYLSDVSLSDKQARDDNFTARFSASLWFTRGWTLQELLAPEQAMFYDANWKEIGGKDLLCGMISAATGIDELFISRDGKLPLSVHAATVATRMSWASRRKTSRSEDMAYCLLGLFDVNMPLLYGEGAEKAFIRLQMEIINRLEDETIFAWTAEIPLAGILATEPSYFADSEALRQSTPYGYSQIRFWTTNKGLALQIPDSEWPSDVSHEPGTEISVRLFVLFDKHRDIGIQVMRMNDRNVWSRCMCNSLVQVPKKSDNLASADKGAPHIIYIPLSLRGYQEKDSYAPNRLWFRV
ncbi:MAG: hypothetical protein Q9166_002622 [cf. Caloplaca sp. 2 TL-2023]